MLKLLLSNHLKELRRTSLGEQSLGVSIFLGFIILIMLSYLLLLGIFIDKILLEFYPDADPILVFNGFLIGYFAFDLLIRFMMQDLPVLSIEPYLHLPLRRSSLVHFLLSQSFLSLFNWFPLLVFVPYAIKVLMPVYPTAAVVAWLVAIMMFIFNNNFLAIYIKRFFGERPILIFALIGIISLGSLFNYLGWIDISAASTTVFSAFLSQPWLIVIPVLLTALSYFINYQSLKGRAYIEEISTKKKAVSTAGNLSFLNKFGQLGEMINLEIKLILRNKRPKTVAIMSAFFIFYGLIFYTQEIYLDGYGMLFFCGTFITGVFMINYGQFLLSWHSSFFDAILVNNIDSRTYLESKYWIFVSSCVFFFLCSIPYVYFGLKVLAINFACFLLNVGINSHLFLYFASKDPKKIDIGKKATFNWEGTGATQIILMIPFFLLPIIIYLPFWLLDIPAYSIPTIAIIGLIGFFFHEPWMKMLTKRFIDRKYLISSKFRMP